MAEDKRIRAALEVASNYGQIDGDHHKAWVIDQIVRALLGSEEAYKQWVKLYENPVNQDDTYEWGTGIAP